MSAHDGLSFRAARRLACLFVLLCAVVAGCGDNIKLVGEKSITSFSIDGVAGRINGDNIAVTLPSGTDVTSLTPSITFIGESLSPASGVTQDFTSPVVYTVTASDGTTRDYSASVTVDQSNARALTSFSFRAADNAELTQDVTATISGTTITATVPFSTDVTALVASFATTGASVRIGTTTQVSGTTPNDFTNPVEYTVVAEDGSLQTYTVTVIVALSDAKSITSYNFEAANNAGLTSDVTALITGTTITATVPFGTDVTGLVATFSTTGTSVTVGATAQISGTTANDFSTAVTYTVTAADSSTQNYTVIVTVALSSAKELGPFQFFTVDNPELSVDVTATISGNTITAIVPFGTDITSLVATFATTGESVNIGGTAQVSGETENDFTTPLTYTVVAADGSTQDYIVTVNNSLSDDKDITQFSILGVDGIISGTQISLTVPTNTNLTSLVPTIVITGVSVSPANGVPQDFTTPRTYTVTAADNTTKSYTVTVTIAGNSDKDITRFTINGLDAIIASTSATTGTISLNMPNGTLLTNLTPIVTITGVSVSPESGVARDFSGPVDYVVTAGDGSTKTYTVNIGVVNGNGTKLISSFTILGVQGSITNGASSSTVMLTLPAGTDLSAQTPTIVINGSSLSPPSRVPQDFSVPVQYTVTAADGSTRVYTVTVSLSP